MLAFLGLTFEEWSYAGIIALPLITFFTLVPLAYSAVLTGRSVRFATYIQVLDRLESYREERHLLDKIEKPYTLDKFKALETPEQDRLDNLGRAYDQVALMIKHRAVPIGFILDFYSRPLVIAWSRLQAHIRDTRISRGQPKHMILFQHLAFAAKYHRDRTHPGEDTFVVSSEEWAEWKKAWKR
jgi:hypothetical protein